jgi:hypothetical protein
MTEGQIRDLVTFALRELPRMRREDGMYCAEVLAGDAVQRGRSIRYSAIVALGLLRARAAAYRVDADLDSLVDLLMDSSRDSSLTPGDIGLLLWLERRAGCDRATELVAALERRLAGVGDLRSREVMEVAWIALGAAECVCGGVDGPAKRMLHAARTQLCSHNRGSSGLLRHREVGWRRRFPNFATEIYGLLALSRIARLGDHGALAAAREVGDALLRLQRADGGWPWIFDATNGRIVEPYPIYSVHQDAMAPIGLFELYDVTGDDRYRAAAARGVEWIYSQNELGVPMLDPDRRMLYRSIRRRAPWDRIALYANTASACVGVSLWARWPTRLEINRTDRPYHLGWVLEAWCGRERLVSGANSG